MNLNFIEMLSDSYEKFQKMAAGAFWAELRLYNILKELDAPGNKDKEKELKFEALSLAIKLEIVNNMKERFCKLDSKVCPFVDILYFVSEEEDKNFVSLEDFILVIDSLAEFAKTLDTEITANERERSKFVESPDVVCKVLRKVQGIEDSSELISEIDKLNQEKVILDYFNNFLDQMKKEVVLESIRERKIREFDNEVFVYREKYKLDRREMGVYYEDYGYTYFLENISIDIGIMMLNRMQGTTI